MQVVAWVPAWRCPPPTFVFHPSFRPQCPLKIISGTRDSLETPQGASIHTLAVLLFIVLTLHRAGTGLVEIVAGVTQTEGV